VLPDLALVTMISFLSVSEHLHSAAPLCKQLLAAAKTRLSWGDRADFSRARGLPTAPAVNWAKVWRCRPLHVVCALPRRPRYEKRRLESDFLAAVSAKAERITVVNFVIQGLCDPDVDIWTAERFPSLTALDIAIPYPVPAFDGMTARLPLLRTLRTVQEYRPVKLDPAKLPQLRSVQLGLAGDGRVDPSVLPLLTEVTLHHPSEGLVLQLAGITSSKPAVVLSCQGNSDGQFIAQLEMCLRYQLPVRKVVVSAIPGPDLFHQLVKLAPVEIALSVLRGARVHGLLAFAAFAKRGPGKRLLLNALARDERHPRSRGGLRDSHVAAPARPVATEPAQALPCL
jgi:hypothetical protein